MSVDDEGTEFATAREPENYGARVAREVGMDDRDYSNAEVSVVDARGHAVARHPVHRQLPN